MSQNSSQSFLVRFITWRVKHIPDRQYILILAVVVGFLAGLAAIVLKKITHFITYLLTSDFATQYENYFYFFYPAIGILLAVLFYAVYRKG